MFTAGDKVKVKRGTVIFTIWEMLEDKEGTITNDDPALWDCIVIFPGSGRDGDRFGFMFDQLEAV